MDEDGEEFTFQEVDDSVLQAREEKRKAKQARIMEFLASQQQSATEGAPSSFSKNNNIRSSNDEPLQSPNTDESETIDSFVVLSPTSTTVSASALTLEERETKWGFTLEHLKIATQVVTTLYHNPSLYIGDPFLAESNLFSMIARGKRVKKDNHEFFRYEDNKKKKANSQRAADLALIKKTTMKRERDEALSSILQDATVTHEYLMLKAAEGEEGNESTGLMMITAGKKEAAAGEGAIVEESSTPQQKDKKLRGPLFASSPTSKSSCELTTDAEKKAAAELATIAARAMKQQQESADAANKSLLKTDQESSSSCSSLFANAGMYHARAMAGFELIDVIHFPQKLVPLISQPKNSSHRQRQGNEGKSTAAIYDENDTNDNDDKKTTGKNPAVMTLSHADVQNWRCHLTSLYHRFWPIKELTTQMTRPFPVADTWPALVNLNAANSNTTTPQQQKSRHHVTTDSTLFTVDTVHEDLCVATSRLSLFFSMLLDQVNENGSQQRSDDHHSNTVVLPIKITELLDELQDKPYTRANTKSQDADDEDALVRERGPSVAEFLSFFSSSSDLDKSAKGNNIEEKDKDVPSNRLALLYSLFTLKSDACAKERSFLEQTVVTDPRFGFARLCTAADLRKDTVETVDADVHNTKGELERQANTLRTVLYRLKQLVESSVANKECFVSFKQNDLLYALNIVLSPEKDATKKRAVAMAIDRVRLFIQLLRLLSEATKEQWSQYNRKFASLHEKCAQNRHGGKGKGSGGADVHFDPNFVASDEFKSSNGENFSRQQQQQQGEQIDEDEGAGEHPDVADPFFDPKDTASTCPDIQFGEKMQVENETIPENCLSGRLLSRRNFPIILHAVTSYFAAFLYKNEAVEVPSQLHHLATRNNQFKNAETGEPLQRYFVHNKSRELFNDLKLAWLGLPPDCAVDGSVEGEDGLYETRNTYTNYGIIPYDEALTIAAPTVSEPIVSLKLEMTLSQKLNAQQNCYSCRGKYVYLHPYYYAMCRPCSEYNYNKRLITRDLRGKVVLLTGTRIKIGYAMAVSLLRCGATLIGTTRFTMDATNRFAAEPDYEEWRHRLHLYSVDLRDMWMVTQFCNFISIKFPKIFAIVNNAAQTIARTAAYTADLRRLEANPPPQLAEKFAKDSTATEWRQFFFEHSSVTIGQSLHLEYHPTQNPVVEGDFTSENTQLRTNAVTGVVGASLSDARAFSAAAENFLASETPEQKYERLKRDGGDVVGTAVMTDTQLATTLARRSDRYDTFAEETDKRAKNSWSSNLAEVHGSEAAEVMAINALSPFILNSRLKPLLMNREGEEDTVDPNATISNRERRRESTKWSTKKSSRFIINVSAMEGQFYRYKGTTHPHTNMAKAALNMMTRTSAEDYARDGIFMNSVDTGWITDESPASIKERRAEDELRIPIDEVDAAARCLDLIFVDSREYGKFWKDYKVIPW